MPTLVRRLPYFDVETLVPSPGAVVPVYRDQIVLWVSLAEPGTVLPRDTPRFPALLDPGTNHNFLIQERHLIDWAGLDRRSLTLLNVAKVNGRLTPVYEANVWLHPIIPGKRDPSPTSHPFCMELDEGIGVSPIAWPFPRLPLLGLGSLQSVDARLTINCKARLVSIGIPMIKP
jgi:hypothetical protein